VYPVTATGHVPPFEHVEQLLFAQSRYGPASYWIRAQHRTLAASVTDDDPFTCRG
jgi:hypothetical protein